MKKMTTEQALDELSMEQVLPVKNKMDWSRGREISSGGNEADNSLQSREATFLH